MNSRRHRDRRRGTSLEHLPTEIFLQIFDFLSLRELITAFFELNSYILKVGVSRFSFLRVPFPRKANPLGNSFLRVF